MREGPRVKVRFLPAVPTTVILQGPALRAYERWLLDPSYQREKDLEHAIYDQCSDHVVNYSDLEAWEYAE